MSSQFNREDFLEAIFEQYFSKHEGFIMVQAARHNDHKVSTRYFPNIDTLVKEKYLEDQNVYFGVCPHERMKPGASNIEYVSCLWAGLDFSPDGHAGREGHFAEPSSAARAVRSFPLAPSLIVESGSGLHLYWLLNEVARVQDHDNLPALLRKVNDFFKCRRKVELDSTLRLPETINCKNSNRLLDCKLKYANPDFRYSLEEFENLDLSSRTIAAVMGQPVVAAGEDAEDMPEEITAERDSASETDNVAVEIIEEYLAREKLSESTVEETAEAPEAEHEAGQLISDQYLDEIADKIADRILANFTEDLADRIADRILARISSVKSEGKQ